MKEDNLDIKDYSIYVRSWNPSSWTLSDKMEIVVTKTTSMKDLASLIYVQNDSIPMDKMEVCRILSIHKFNILDLCDMEVKIILFSSIKWHKLQSSPNLCLWMLMVFSTLWKTHKFSQGNSQKRKKPSLEEPSNNYQGLDLDQMLQAIKNKKELKSRLLKKKKNRWKKMKKYRKNPKLKKRWSPHKEIRKLIEISDYYYKWISSALWIKRLFENNKVFWRFLVMSCFQIKLILKNSVMR